MRYRNVLLVSPRFHLGRNRLALCPLAGIAYLAESLTNAGINVSVFDMNLGYSFEDLKQKIETINPDIIGFSVMTLGYRAFYEMVKEVKKIFPTVKILVGGAHISALSEDVLKECDDIDYGIRLEGDLNVKQLCLGEDVSAIPGLMYRDGEKIVYNEAGGFIKNLDELSFPKYEAFELDKYPTKQIGIVTSRGCPYDCIYCSVISTSGKNFRVRSAQSVVEEIEYWYGKGYREVLILDDNFTLIRKRVEEVCSLLIAKKLTGLHLKCPNGIRADRVDRDLLAKMKEAGFDFIAFGVEAGTNKVLKNLKKGEHIEIIEQSIKDACELGFDVDLFFLIGSPGETVEDVEASFALAQRYPLRRAIFYNLIPLPATELLDWVQQQNYLIYPLEDILNNASYYANRPCFFTPELSVEQRKELVARGQKIMLNIRRRHIERKLSGPLFFRQWSSFLYTHPLWDDALVNNKYVVAFKEKLKKVLFP